MPISPVGNKYINYCCVRGFSLLELLVVLIVVSFLLVLAGPHFYHSLEGLRTKQLVRNMIADIRITRNTAIQSGQQQTWTLDIKNHQYWSSATNKKQAFSNNVDVRLTVASKERQSGSIASIRFFPAGGSTGGKIVLSQQQIKYVFEVDWLTGMVRFE